MELQDNILRREATFVRLRKEEIRARVKGDLPIEFSGERISAHGGLEVFGRYLRAWDSFESPHWDAEASPYTAERRAAVYDRLAVEQAFRARCCADALDPELAELALAGPSVSVGVVAGVHDRLVGRLPAPRTIAVVALGPLQNDPAALLGMNGALDSCH